MLPSRSATPRWPGPALILAGSGFLVTEWIVASTRESPRYSYIRNYISDLGAAHAPHSLTMNAAFVLNGTLTAAAAALKGQPPSRARAALLALALTYGLGIAMAGVFHQDTAPTLHGIGAALCIPAGNLSLIALAWLLHQRGHHPVPVVAAGAAGMIGAVGTVLTLVHAMPERAGIAERVAAYPNLLGQVFIGMGLILSNRSRR